MSDPLAVDIHTHVVPGEFPPYLGKRLNVPWPSMAPAQPCHCHVMISGKVYRTVHQSCWRTEDRTADMDTHAIGVQCLSPMPELLSYWLPADDAQVLIRYINDQIAGMVARGNGRFIGLGGVPLQDVDLAIRELEYLMNDLKFAGVEIATHIDGVPIGDARLDPFFAACERLGAAVFVHALHPAGADRIVGPVAEQAVAFPGEVALGIASMITGGMAERHPKLRIAFSHGGGGFAVLLPRLAHAWNIQPKFKESLPQDPTVYARRFFYDTVVFDLALLRHVVATYGRTQVCAGSDYPFAMGDLDPVKTIRAAGLDDETRGMLLAGNALRFLGRA